MQYNNPSSSDAPSFFTNHKSEVITALVLVVLALLVAGGYFIYTAVSGAARESANAAYRQNHTHTYEKGQVARLNANEDKEGIPYGYVAGLDWTGILEATLEQVQVFDTPAQAGFDESKTTEGLSVDQQVKSRASLAQGYKFVQCNLKLHNVDAQAAYPNEYLRPLVGGDARYGLHCSEFTLHFSNPLERNESQYADFVEGVYENNSAHVGGYYLLKPAEDRVLKLGFLVPLTEDGPFSLWIGAAGNAKYAINFTLPN